MAAKSKHHSLKTLREFIKAGGRSGAKTDFDRVLAKAVKRKDIDKK